MDYLSHAGLHPRFLDPHPSAAMSHRPIHDPNLPKPVGPYSPGMGFERLVFVSGQGATDPATGKLSGPDATSQTEQCLKNVETILKAAGTDLQHVLQCRVFLLDMKEFNEMNGVYGRMYSLFLLTAALAYTALVDACAAGGRRRWAIWGVATLVAIAIKIFLLIKVVPVFGEIFSGFNAKLPAPTQLLIDVSDFVKRWFILMFLAGGGIAYGLINYVKTPSGRARSDDIGSL